MTSWAGWSVGLPMPRSMTSMPARRFWYLRALILPKRYGGSRLTRSATSMRKGVCGVFGSLCMGAQPEGGKPGGWTVLSVAPAGPPVTFGRRRRWRPPPPPGRLSPRRVGRPSRGVSPHAARQRRPARAQLPGHFPPHGPESGLPRPPRPVAARPAPPPCPRAGRRQKHRRHPAVARWRAESARNLRPPAEYRGPLRVIWTKRPGSRLGEMLPNHARHAYKLVLVRSVQHDNGNHFAG